jgi:hypothetical protein
VKARAAAAVTELPAARAGDRARQFVRALVMVLDRLGPEEIIAREVATGVPMI